LTIEKSCYQTLHWPLVLVSPTLFSILILKSATDTIDYRYMLKKKVYLSLQVYKSTIDIHWKCMNFVLHKSIYYILKYTLQAFKFHFYFFISFVCKIKHTCKCMRNIMSRIKFPYIFLLQKVTSISASRLYIICKCRYLIGISYICPPKTYYNILLQNAAVYDSDSVLYLYNSATL